MLKTRDRALARLNFGPLKAHRSEKKGCYKTKRGLNSVPGLTYHSSHQTITKPTCEVRSVSGPESCLVSQEPTACNNKHQQTGTEEHILQWRETLKL